MLKNKKLPRKPSALILIALDDLKKVERLPDIYKIDMGTWHEPDMTLRSTGKCSVCFAGAVMAQELGCEPIQICTPGKFPPDTDAKLNALNFLRSGDAEEAISYLDFKTPVHIRLHKLRADKPKLFKIPKYRKANRLKFHAAMRKMATALAKIGL